MRLEIPKLFLEEDLATSPTLRSFRRVLVVGMSEQLPDCIRVRHRCSSEGGETSLSKLKQ